VKIGIIENKNGSPGRTRTCNLLVTRAPGFLPGLDYLFTRPSREGRARVSGASPAPHGRTRMGGGVRARALVSAPSPPIRRTGKGLAQDYPFRDRGGRASLSSPDSSTTISRGSCKTYSQPLCQLSYRGVAGDKLTRIESDFKKNRVDLRLGFCYCAGVPSPIPI